MTSSIKSAERVLKILEYFASRQQPVRIMELSQALRIPQSSTSMLVKNLVSLGYLEGRADNRSYWPTLRLALLGDWMSNGLNLRTSFVNACQQIAERCGEVTFLAIHNGIFSQYVLVLDPKQSGSMNIQSGMMRPLTRSSTGICFLSRLEDDEIGRIIRRVNAEIMDSNFRRSGEEVMLDVGAARRQGYFHADGFMEPGVGSIAKLVENGNDSTPLAIAVGGASQNIEKKKQTILEALEALRQSLTGGSAIAPEAAEPSVAMRRLQEIIHAD